MPVCPSCSREVAAGKKFCTFCGASLAAPAAAERTVPLSEIVCPHCRCANRVTVKFCKSCGQPLAASAAPSPPAVAATFSCSACGASNREGAKFCRNCGGPLAAGVAPATPSPAAVPRAAAVRPPALAAQAAARPVASRPAPFAAALEPETNWRRYALVAGSIVVVFGLGAATWYLWLVPMSPSSVPAASTPTAEPPLVPSTPDEATAGEPSEGSPSSTEEAVETSSMLPPPSDYSVVISEKLSAANKEFEQGNYCRARQYCDEALQLHPYHHEAQALRNKIQQTIRILGVECGATAKGATPGTSSCGLEGSLRSQEGLVETEVTFSNDTQKTLTVYWLDYEGHRKRWGIILPNAVWRAQTFATHPWLLADESGNCVEIHVAGQMPSRVVIEDKQ